jgi:hypothetical protein
MKVVVYFNPQDKVLVTIEWDVIRRWVGPRADTEVLKNKKVFFLCRVSNSASSIP